MTKRHLWQGLEKKDGTPLQGEPGAFDDLEELVRFTATAPDAQFRSELATRLDLRTYSDWWILAVSTLALDSTGKNAFHWHPPGARWTYVPWDFNASFGQNWDTKRERATRGDQFEDRNEIFRRMLGDDTFAEPMQRRFGELLRGAWRDEDVLATYDALVAGIAPVARRDERRWLQKMRDHYQWTDARDVELETEWTREWLRDRWDYLRRAYP